MTPSQCRAARALLDLTQPRLAEAASLGLSTVVDFERTRRSVSDDAVAAIRLALEAAGVIFVEENGEGAGVRLRKNWAFEGLDAIAAHLGVDVDRAAEIIVSGEIQSFETRPGGHPCVSQDAMREYKLRR